MLLLLCDGARARACERVTDPGRPGAEYNIILYYRYAQTVYTLYKLYVLYIYNVMI